ncbi:MAG: C39 family peptidase [Lachnospiraceae bacterium]|nr:C39 family peptidase [Lachnospiraceae bacterium]
MNRETQRKTVLICIIMIVAGVCLFLNAASGLTSYWGSNSGRRSNTAGMGDGQAVSAETDSFSEPTTEASPQALAAVQGAMSPGSQVNLMESSDKIRYIRSHEKLYPEELLSLLSRNVETVDFVYSYPKLVKAGLNTEAAAENITFTKAELKEKHPLFLQWDTRWGAIPYGSSMMALSGCGPTCLSMAAVALTGDKNATPAAVAAYSMEQGYYMEGQGTAWSLMYEGCKNYGLKSEDIACEEEEMAQKLSQGCVLICSVAPGDFTQNGHFIVIYGYDDGWFEINDPNSVNLSNAKWKFDRLKGQIRNIWAMSAADE